MTFKEALKDPFDAIVYLQCNKYTPEEREFLLDVIDMYRMEDYLRSELPSLKQLRELRSIWWALSFNSELAREMYSEIRRFKYTVACCLPLFASQKTRTIFYSFRRYCVSGGLNVVV